MNERRAKLMAARDEAVRNRDWALMSEITKRLAKLPVPKITSLTRSEVLRRQPVKGFLK